MMCRLAFRFAPVGPLAAAALLSLAAATPARAQNAFDFQTILTGLDNPRGIAFGPNGALYVAEAGRGGNGPAVTGGNGTATFGATGAVTRFQGGVQTRVLTGLPSLADQTANPPGGGATGLHDIVFNTAGEAFGVIGLGANPSARATLGADGALFGQLVRLTVDGSNAAPVAVADLAAFEAANNPDAPAPPDTNPYSLVALPGGGFAAVDAGANTLLNVTAGGAVSLLSVFPPKPNPLPFGPPFYQSVPTSVALGPGGTFFVGELTGFPFPQGGASVYNVAANGTFAAIPGGGFTNVIDLILGTDGNLYVLQLTTNGLAGQFGPGPGQLLRVNPLTGARTVLVTTSPLFFPGGLAQGPDGSLYISNLSVSPGGGQVVRLVASSAPDPAAGSLLAVGGGLMFLSRFPRRRRA